VKMKLILSIALMCLCTLLLSAACGRSNNLLLSRVEAKVGGHTVAVTDCYRTSVPRAEQISESANDKPVYRWGPCRDADILIRGDELVVNGRMYGRLKDGDEIVVDHGKVLINEEEARGVASR
jgi:hypothetical protein